MYRLCAKLTYLLLPVLVLLASVNYCVDGGNVLGGINRRVAEIIVSGNNAGIKNDSLRWANLQVSIAERTASNSIRQPKDILVFGTSRSSEISSDLFDNTLFNCVVPGGNILDYVALYGLYKKNRMLPKYVIISIDPWSFFSRKGETINGKNYDIADTVTPLKVYEGFEDYFEFGLKDIGVTINEKADNNPARKFHYVQGYLQLFSPEYFKISLQSLLSSPFGPVFATDKSSGSPYFVIRKDGSYSFVEEANVDSLFVKEISEKFAEAHKGRFFMYDKTNKKYIDCLYALTDSLKKEGVVPIIYFSPLNPIIYDKFIKYERNDTEKMIKEHCRRQNIFTMGSFNPHEYGIDETGRYFFDEYHPVKSVIQKIIYEHSTELRKVGLIVQKRY